MKISAQNIYYFLKKIKRPWLSKSFSYQSNFFQHIPELYPVNGTLSDNRRFRLNLMIPTIQPEKFFGGISTALDVTISIINNLKIDYDLRIFITSDIVTGIAINNLGTRFGYNFTSVSPSDDLKGLTLVSLYEKKDFPASIRKNDIFLATAWWTADLSQRLMDVQYSMFGKHQKMIYLIQDFEPGFYPWSNKYCLAEATYKKKNIIALINSEELYEFFLKRYKFIASHCIPYKLNSIIKSKLQKNKKKKTIIVYGRPSVHRNCFYIIVEGLRIWQRRNPSLNTSYQISFVGEDLNRNDIDELENATVLGKLNLDNYANLLSEASIGISLMASPHPSYPPLEMASAGCYTITNRFDCKNLTLRSKNIKSLDTVCPEALADALDEALKYISHPKYAPNFFSLKSSFADIDYKTFIEELVSNLDIKETLK